MESADGLKKAVQERRISRGALERLLEYLDTRDVINGITIYADAGSIPDHFQPSGNSSGSSIEELQKLTARIEKSETGSVSFWSDGFAPSHHSERTHGGSDEWGSKLVIFPPFPVARKEVLTGWDSSQLRMLLARQYLLDVVLLRLGRFAVGVFRGDVLVSSKTDTRYVKGKHSAGGQSQKRFERIREKQAQELFRKTCSVVKEHFSPFEDQLDYIFLGGERFTLRGLLKRCEYLQTLSPKILGRVLNIREPKHDALQRVIETIWESRVLSVR